MRSTLHRLGRLARAMLTIAAMVAIPVVLIGFGAGVPSVAQLKVAYDLHWVSSHLATQLATGLALLVWAYLIVWVAVEVVSTHRGGVSRAPKWVRPVVGKLAAILLMTSLRLPMAGPMALASSTVPAPAPVVRVALTSQASPTALVQHHRVVAGDNLWDLADEYYGSGTHWKTIWDANYSVDPDPDLIYPGQMLVVPSLATPAPPATPPASVAAPAPPPAVNGARAPANGAGAITTGHAGSSGGPSHLAPGTPAPVSNGHTAAAAASSPAPNEVRAPAMKVTPPPVKNGAPRGAVSLARRPTPPASPVHQAGAGYAVLAGELLLGGVAAAGIVRMLMRLRRRQLNRIPLDRRAPEPDRLLVPTEVALHRVEDQAGLDRLTDALGALWLGLGDRAGDVPTILGVMIDSDLRITLRLDQADEDAPGPFRTTDNAQAWVLDAHAALPEGLGQAEPLLPALVSVGRTKADEEVLVNLEAFGSVSLVGPGSAGLLRSWVTELGTKAWSDCLTVVAVGLGAEMRTLERVEVVADLDETQVQAMVAHGRQVSQLVEDAGDSSLLGVRLHGQADNWAPRLVCCAEVPSRQVLSKLRLALASSARSGVVLAAAGPMAEAGLVLDAAGDEMPVTPLGVTVRPHKLTAAVQASIGGLLNATNDQRDLASDDPAFDLEVSPTQAARELVDPADFFPEPDDLLRPATLTNGSNPFAAKDRGGARIGPESEEDDALRDARRLAARVLEPSWLFEDPEVDGDEALGAQEVWVGPGEPQARVDAEEPRTVEVCVLGPVTVRGAVGDLSQGKTEELVAYLALHPSGEPLARLRRALWAGEPVSSKTVQNTVARARMALGLDSLGQPYLTRLANKYELVELVTTDWARFSKLVAQSGASDVDDVVRGCLREALSLVRGEPFADSGPRSYEWICGPLSAEDRLEPLFKTMTGAIADAAEALADACMAAGDRSGAAWAADQGLLGCPTDERLGALRMRLAKDPDEAEAICSQLGLLVDEDLSDEVLVAYREVCSQGV